MDEGDLKVALTAVLVWLRGPAGPRGNDYSFLAILLELALENPSQAIRRADVLFALDRPANTPTSEYVRTGSLLRAWEIVVRHCSSTLAPKAGHRVNLRAETVTEMLVYTFVSEARSEASSDPSSGYVLEGGCLRYSEEVTNSSLGLHGRLRYPRQKLNITRLAPRLRFVSPTLLYIALFIGTAMFCWASVMALVVKPSANGAVTCSIVLIFAALIYYARIAPAFKSKADRISIIPERYMKVDAVPAALEYLRDGESRYVRIVNFTSSCVICGGDVHLANGRYDLKGRIVGECIESPLEHIYSFDRMTLEGVPLRARLGTASQDTRINCEG